MRTWFGLARRAGKVAAGASEAKTALASGKACLILLAGDAGRGVERDIELRGRETGVPIFRCWSKQELGELLGEKEKAVAVITDHHLALRIRDSAVMVGTAGENGGDI